MMRLHTLYLSVPRLHALVDDDARLIYLYRVAGHRIESGAIMGRSMTGGMLSPGFDGESLKLDAWSLMRVIDFIDRTSRPATSDASRARRFRGLVEASGLRAEQLAALRRVTRDEPVHTTGEQAVFDRFVTAQLWAAHLRYWMIPEEQGAAERGARLIEGMSDQLAN